MIADVRGYTAFTQTHGDEAAAHLAAAFAGIVREGVEAHGGEVIELRGDEALAAFDSAREAIRAAVELQQTFAHEVEVDPSLPLRVGIGLDAGEAVELEGGFRGGALNLAARLCSRAAPGEVLASRGVTHLARAVEGVTFTDHGTVDAKGIDEPVPVVAASATAPAGLRLHAPATTTELPRELDPVTPIIGRDRDQRRLAWAWRRARRGLGSVIVVCGPSGIGKTRLAAAAAELPARDGGAIEYRSHAAGDPGDAEAPASGAVYIVVDDLECAGTERALEALRAAATATAGPALVLIVFDEERADSELVATAHRLAGDAGMLRPAPLGIEAIRSIAALYLGDAVDLLPSGLLEASGGVPSRVHEAVGAWAHAEAARRLGEAAAVAAAGRSDLRSVEQTLAGRVTDLQLVHEQSRLFGARMQPDEHAAAPYRGLASFGAEDSEWFFGRERLVADLVARLAGTTLLGVVGPSGSGKSSAVRAGLVPALAAGVLPGSERWTVATMRPGEHPLRELDRAVWAALPEALRRRLEGEEYPLRGARDELAGGDRLLLVVDQFEEVFTTCTDEWEQRAFISALTEAARDPRGNEVIVLALRADYYGRCAVDPQLAELLSANQVLVGLMTAEEYRRVIEQPALRAGVRVEPALSDELVAEVVGEPGALPLLSTALLELWERREGRRALLLASHLASGGVQGAVARLAEAAYAQFDDDQQAVARAVLLRLAGPGEGTAVVRRRVPIADFDTGRNPAVAAVLDVLTSRRLLTLSDGHVEVAHEALLREWPRFQEWLEQDREGRRLHAHLADSARDWQERGHEPGELYRGTRLAAALDWTTQHTLELNELEKEFVAASREQSQRAVRRLRAGLIAMAVLLLLALVGGVIALVQRRTAQHEATVALARQLGAEAVVEPRLDRAMLLAREAVRLDDSTQTQGSLLSTLLRSPSALATFTVPITVRPLQLLLSGDGRRLVVNDNQGELRLFDTTTHRQVGSPIAGVGGFGGAMALTPDGGHIVALDSNDPAMSVIDLATRHVDHKLPWDHALAVKPTSPADPVLVSPDGRTVYCVYAMTDPATGAEHATFADVWHLGTGVTEPVQKRLLQGELGVAAAKIIDGGKRMLTVSQDAAYTWALPSFRLLHTMSFTVPNPGPFGDISPDTHYAVILNGTAQSFSIVDLRSGSVTPYTAASGIQNAVFAPSGDRVVTVEEAGEAQIWVPGSPSPVQTLTGHGGRVTGTTFSRDGTTLYTSSLDGAVFKWDVSPTGGRGFGRTFSVPPSPDSLWPPLAIAPSGKTFATTDGTRITLWSTSNLRRIRSFGVDHAGAAIDSLAWSPGPTPLLAVGWSTVTNHGTYNLYAGTVDLRTATGALVRRLPARPGQLGRAQQVAWSRDGTRVGAITSTQVSPTQLAGALAVWDTHSGRLLGTVSRPRDSGKDLAFSPDGGTLATAWDSGNAVVLYDTRTLHATRTIGVEGLATAVAYTPDGRLTTATFAGIVQRWDPATGTQIGRPTQVAPAPINRLSFSPDGGTLVTVGQSHGIPKLWTTSTLQQLGSDFPGDPGQFVSAAYTADGKDIVVVSSTGKGWEWPATLGAWESHACDVAGRNLTREEWSRYVTGRAYSTVC